MRWNQILTDWNLEHLFQYNAVLNLFLTFEHSSETSISFCTNQIRSSNFLWHYGNGISFTCFCKWKILMKKYVDKIQYLIYSGHTLKLYITFVPVIRTSKHFWPLQCIWHQTMVIYPWCITTCSHWNHCIWSQELWEHKFLVFKNGLLFYRFMVD